MDEATIIGKPRDGSKIHEVSNLPRQLEVLQDAVELSIVLPPATSEAIMLVGLTQEMV